MELAKVPFPSAERRLTWLRITTAIALIFGFCLSWKLWVSSRLFPLCPVANFLPSIPFPLDHICLFVLLGLLVTSIGMARSRAVLLACVGLAGVIALWDQMRWQPWFYQYLFVLSAIAVYTGKKLENQHREAALNVCQLIIACTYIWGGLQKLNVNFVRETWPDVTGSLLRVLSKHVKTAPFVLILLVPVMEVAIGLGLINRKSRNAAVLVAIATHIVILLVLVSGGENRVVWPWNLAMILFVAALFWKNQETDPRSIFVPRNVFHALVLLLFGLLPVFSFFGLWDSYLSAALYSGNTDQAVIILDSAVIDRLPMAVHSDIWQSSRPFFLDINRWSYDELNVPTYPEPRVYKQVAERICVYTANSSMIKLMIRERPDVFSGRRKSNYYDCDHLDQVTAKKLNGNLQVTYINQRPF